MDRYWCSYGINENWKHNILYDKDLQQYDRVECVPPLVPHYITLIGSIRKPIRSIKPTLTIWDTPTDLISKSEFIDIEYEPSYKADRAHDPILKTTCTTL